MKLTIKAGIARLITPKVKLYKSAAIVKGAAKEKAKAKPFDTSATPQGVTSAGSGSCARGKNWKRE